MCLHPILPHPIMVEPPKPHLCHDERFLNSWIRIFHLNWITFQICPGMVCLSIARLPVTIKVGISMSFSIHCQKLTLGLNGKMFSSCFIPCLLVGRQAPLSTTILVLLFHTACSFGVPLSQYINNHHVRQLLSPQAHSVSPPSAQRAEAAA